MWRAHKAAGTKIRLQIIGQKNLAHLSPEAEDLRAHWLATTDSLVTGPKTTATNEGARLLLRIAHPATEPSRRRRCLTCMGSPKPISKGQGERHTVIVVA